MLYRLLQVKYDYPSSYNDEFVISEEWYMIKKSLLQIMKMLWWKKSFQNLPAISISKRVVPYDRVKEVIG